MTPVSEPLPRSRATLEAAVRRALPSIIAVAAILGLAATTLLHGPFSFDFLRQPTNTEIGFSFFPFQPSDPYWRAFAAGVSNTLVIAAAAIVLATLLGLALSLARLSTNPVLGVLTRLYTDVVRNIPVILQTMFWYALYLSMPRAKEAIALAGIQITNRGIYFPWLTDAPAFAVALLALIALAACIPVLRKRRRPTVCALLVALAGLATAGLVWSVSVLAEGSILDLPELRGLNFRGGLRMPVEFAALLTALVLYRGAYISEVFRAGFRAISRGHLDAAYALSLGRWTTFSRIRLPLALITIVPPLASEFIVIVKITSIGLLVGFADLYSVSVNATTLTGRTLEIMLLMTLLYLAINYLIAIAINTVNRRFAFMGGADK